MWECGTLCCFLESQLHHHCCHPCEKTYSNRFVLKIINLVWRETYRNTKSSGSWLLLSKKFMGSRIDLKGYKKKGKEKVELNRWLATRLELWGKSKCIYQKFFFLFLSKLIFWIFHFSPWILQNNYNTKVLWKWRLCWLFFFFLRGLFTKCWVCF